MVNKTGQTLISSVPCCVIPETPVSPVKRLRDNTYVVTKPHYKGKDAKRNTPEVSIFT